MSFSSYQLIASQCQIYPLSMLYDAGAGPCQPLFQQWNKDSKRCWRDTPMQLPSEFHHSPSDSLPACLTTTTLSSQLSHFTASSFLTTFVPSSLDEFSVSFTGILGVVSCSTSVNFSVTQGSLSHISQVRSVLEVRKNPLSNLFLTCVLSFSSGDSDAP